MSPLSEANCFQFLPERLDGLVGDYGFVIPASGSGFPDFVDSEALDFVFLVKRDHSPILLFLGGLHQDALLDTWGYFCIRF